LKEKTWDSVVEDLISNEDKEEPEEKSPWKIEEILTKRAKITFCYHSNRKFHRNFK
jgi:hypothetical protein